MSDKYKPAIIGGVLVGLLSAIPFVNLVNACCCLWAILGGFLASYLYVKRSATPLRMGDGAIIGLMAGIIGAVVYVVLGIPLSIATQGFINEIVLGIAEGINPAQVDLVRRAIAEQTTLGAILWGLFWAFLLIVFSTVGGLIGMAVFEKRKGTQAPPAPTQFTGGQV